MKRRRFNAAPPSSDAQQGRRVTHAVGHHSTSPPQPGGQPGTAMAR
ncbi:MAG TPA: hypothetical protein VLC08_01640 [Chitinolyticbacter sp.]|nr:hypothetical protein [Chitinolyticbacter sp.]